MERKSFEGADFSGVAQAAQESPAAMESTQALEDKLSQEQAEEHFDFIRTLLIIFFIFEFYKF